MAATKYAFLTQPNNTNQGYTIQGGAPTDFSMNGVVLPQTSSSIQASPGIQVACLNADGTLDPTSVSSVTIALAANPTSLTPPVQSAPSTSTLGGTGLAATTQYFYVITGISPTLGESVRSNEVNVTTGAGGTNSNTVNWASNPNFTSYRIYRGTAAGVETVFYAAGNVVTFIDTGAASTGGTPPTTSTTSSTLSGTLTKVAVAGIATFSDLAVTLGGVGYTLQATGALTTATSNSFTLFSVARVANAQLSGTITTIGVGIAQATVGPYRFRGGASVKGVNISATSTVAADAVQIYVTEPGSVATATALTATNAEKITLSTGAVMGVTVTPFSMSIDSDELAGQKDIWVVGTTVTGTITVNIQRIENQGRP